MRNLCFEGLASIPLIMKNYFYSLSLVLIFSCNTHLLISQTQSTVPVESNRNYYTWIKVIGNHSEEKGYLLALEDSSIIFQKNNMLGKELIIEEYPLHQIAKISFRSKNAELNGLLMGGLIGFGIGGILGINGGRSYNGIFFVSPRAKGALWGTILAMPGMLVGGIVGSEKKKFTLRGKQGLYESYKASWEKYIYYRDH